MLERVPEPGSCNVFRKINGCMVSRQISHQQLTGPKEIPEWVLSCISVIAFWLLMEVFGQPSMPQVVQTRFLNGVYFAVLTGEGTCFSSHLLTPVSVLAAELAWLFWVLQMQ